ncbi:type III polyketide synthase [Sporosarcina sp. P37]|uniref:type III polyketide synthase n=1 Tax=unclassified Sporosarcina TaxID=2647733 RepID=UPI0009BD5244|nr:MULTISPECIES: 3-oxoacyl-[acyl-carrier-protein] synthase III C-terminal domain-containing protein [unclassified Sporosarcina]ARD47378.1 chalcone synthase [Sporosarcina sp. P33]ARK23945.1 type III polyketide synthase [Sporosarcina sp. P37]PID17260.1 type III polyketide synthase [Sporosarcina sp. P35]
MPIIQSVSTVRPPVDLPQEEAVSFARSLFSDSFKDIDRLLKVFQNGEIDTRQVCMPLEWYAQAHDFETKNDLYIQHAVTLGKQAVEQCLSNTATLVRAVDPAEIDAIFFVSSSGLATPSIDARLINQLPFRHDIKRVPIWGLGCAGGASGMSRAFDYCKAYPDSNVLVLAVELCSLTFQRDDVTKSNLVGMSLFSDGVACALVSGEQSTVKSTRPMPKIRATSSRFMPDSEDVMGWDIKSDGLHVVFSKSIPAVIKSWLGPFVHQFVGEHDLTMKDILHFVAHPGGKKVLDAYQKALQLDQGQTAASKKILQHHGNMSSPTVLYVLKDFIEQQPAEGEYGLMAALGPGFCGELLLLEWQ